MSNKGPVFSHNDPENVMPEPVEQLLFGYLKREVSSLDIQYMMIQPETLKRLVKAFENCQPIERLTFNIKFYTDIKKQVAEDLLVAISNNTNIKAFEFVCGDVVGKSEPKSAKEALPVETTTKEAPTHTPPASETPAPQQTDSADEVDIDQELLEMGHQIVGALHSAKEQVGGYASAASNALSNQLVTLTSAFSNLQLNPFSACTAPTSHDDPSTGNKLKTQ